MAEVVTKSQTRAMGQRILQMFSDALNSIADDFENLPHPIIRVFSITGSTVTATASNGTVITATESSGVWELKLPSYGEWTVKSITPSNDTFSKSVMVDDVKKYVISLGMEIFRYGYRIREDEADPEKRVEYILDAEGMTPAHMDFENEVFDYGSWADVWFVTDNKPLMLKYDGTVDYYLDPNDYTKKEDGVTESDVSNESYEGNAMVQFPLVWIKRYEDDTYKYEIVSNVQYDETYKAYAHTRADGSIADYFYHSLFGASKYDDKLRSLADKTRVNNIAAANLITLARNNGSKWCMETWSQHEYLRTLVVLISATLNTNTAFGFGRVALSASDILLTGTLQKKGQFFGYNTGDAQVKVFHIEALWEEIGSTVLGVIFKTTTGLWIKMTPEGAGYQETTTNDYISVGKLPPTGFISNMKCSELGMVPTATNGSISTFFCGKLVYGINSSRTYWFSTAYNYVGGTLLSMDFAKPYNQVYWHQGCFLTCEQPTS